MLNGCLEWDRTTDNPVNSRALYQLSYKTKFRVGCASMAHSL